MGVDRALVETAIDGDELAFARLVSAIGDQLFSVALHILRDMGRAEDATQQALLQIWKQLPRLREVERFEAWAYRITVHEAYAESRRRRRWGEAAPLDASLLAAREGPDALSMLAHRDELQRGLDRLSPDHRAVIVLKHYIGLSDDEIADVLQLPVGTVRSRLFYSMKALRAALDAEERLSEGRSTA